jgi:prepilin signal peptidase PulO-like enzyme (type II secretory pathway)
VDWSPGAGELDARDSAAVNAGASVLVAVGWAVVGAGAGWVGRWGSVRLAHLEGLEPGHKRWQVYGPPILCALLFGLFAAELGSFPLIVLRSVFVLVLVQVIFFDFEHRLILDRVMFPSMALALVVSLFDHPWWAGIATGLAAGLLFLLLALAGSAIFKAEALGFGDVKLALFMGLLLGPLPTVQALFYGVFLAGLVSVGFILWHRSMKGTIAYGPYLAAGALIVLFQNPGLPLSSG